MVFGLDLMIGWAFFSFLCIDQHLRFPGMRLWFYFYVFLCMSPTKHVNTKTLWNLLVIIPLTKFGVHLDGFYINVGG
jgi:hypothetical protein